MSLSDYIVNKPILKTNRLILRKLTINDVADLKSWTSNQELYRYWGKRPGKDDLNPELMFEKEKPVKSFLWGIEFQSKIVGQIWIYLIENDRMAKTAFRLSPDVQGNGLMTEALSAVVKFCFENTELQRIWTDVHVDNIASFKTLEKAGFAREGCIRQGKMVNIYCDYYLYGLLKSDYMDK